MQRRGFLGRIAALSAAGFVPFVVKESKVEASIPTPITTKPPVLPPPPVEPVKTVVQGKTLRGKDWVFTSRYSALRIQITPKKAVQFERNVFRTRDKKVAQAVLMAISTRMGEPVAYADRDALLIQEGGI